MDYDKAIKINPECSEFFRNEGFAKDILERHEEAVEDFDKALNLDPKNATAFNNKNFALAKMSQNTLKNQLLEITDPEIIIKKYQSEIDETRYAYMVRTFCII